MYNYFSLGSEQMKKLDEADKEKRELEENAGGVAKRKDHIQGK